MLMRVSSALTTIPFSASPAWADALSAMRAHPSCLGLKTKETIDFDDEGAVGEVGERAAERVALLVVDDEQLAARRVLPAQAGVRAGGMAAGVVLHERADEHRGG